MKWILPLLMLLPLSLPAEQPDSPVGQVASPTASVDGFAVPSGTTILDGSRVETGMQAATIHMLNGQIVRVNSNSTALFTKGRDGSLRVSSERGTVSLRNPDGTTAILVPEREASTSNANISKYERLGIVALVHEAAGRKRAEAGTRIVPVNDQTRVDLADCLLLKTNMDREMQPKNFHQEVVCSIDSASRNVVKVSDQLAYTFEPEDNVIQKPPAPENRVYTLLRSDAKSGLTHLSVLDSKAVNPLEPIAIQSSDGRFREPACVLTTTEVLPENLNDIVINRTLETPNLPESTIEIKNGLRHDYSKGANIIQGRRFAEERIVAKLAGSVKPGSAVLRVKDASGLDPLQQVLLRSPDGERLEAYCISSIEIDKQRDPGGDKDLDRVILVDELNYAFSEGTELIQGRSSQEMASDGISIQKLADCDCCEPVPVTRWWEKPAMWIIGGGAAGTIIGTIDVIDDDDPASPIRP